MEFGIGLVDDLRQRDTVLREEGLIAENDEGKDQSASSRGD